MAIARQLMRPADALSELLVEMVLAAARQCTFKRPEPLPDDAALCQFEAMVFPALRRR